MHGQKVFLNFSCLALFPLRYTPISPPTRAIMPIIIMAMMSPALILEESSE
jgi:hypothetical protein